MSKETKSIFLHLDNKPSQIAHSEIPDWDSNMHLLLTACEQAAAHSVKAEKYSRRLIDPELEEPEERIIKYVHHHSASTSPLRSHYSSSEEKTIFHNGCEELKNELGSIGNMEEAEERIIIYMNHHSASTSPARDEPLHCEEKTFVSINTTNAVPNYGRDIYREQLNYELLADEQIQPKYETEIGISTVRDEETNSYTSYNSSVKTEDQLKLEEGMQYDAPSYEDSAIIQNRADVEQYPPYYHNAVEQENENYVEYSNGMSMDSSQSLIFTNDCEVTTNIVVPVAIPPDIMEHYTIIQHESSNTDLPINYNTGLLQIDEQNSSPANNYDLEFGYETPVSERSLSRQLIEINTRNNKNSIEIKPDVSPVRGLTMPPDFNTWLGTITSSKKAHEYKNERRSSLIKNLDMDIDEAYAQLQKRQLNRNRKLPAKKGRRTTTPAVPQPASATPRKYRSSSHDETISKPVTIPLKRNYTDDDIHLLLEAMKSKETTSLPFKKRRMMAAHIDEMAEIRPISYPATPMLSIAELETLPFVESPILRETLPIQDPSIPMDFVSYVEIHHKPLSYTGHCIPSYPTPYERKCIAALGQ